MKARLLMVSFLMFALLCSCSEQNNESVNGNDKAKEQPVTSTNARDGKGSAPAKGHSVFCMVFLDKEEKANRDIMTAVAKLKKSLQHKVHPIVFAFEVRKDKVAQEVIKKHGIKKFPAAVVDGKLLAKGESLVDACKKAAGRIRMSIDAHLESDVSDKKTLAVTFYICLEGPGKKAIIDGRVMVYALEDDKYKALIADSKDYLVEPNSCHAPELKYWPIYKDIDRKNLRAVMVVYDGEGKILGTYCSADDCTERNKGE